MKQRLITGAVIVTVLALMIVSKLLTPIIFDFGIGVLAVLGATEVAKVFDRSGKYSNVMFASIFPAVSYLILCLGISKSWSWVGYAGWFVGSMGVYYLVIFAMNYIFLDKTKKEIANKKLETTVLKYSLTKALNTIVVCIYPTLLFATFIVINHINDLPMVANNPVLLDANLDFFLIVIIFAVQILTDSLAMVIGSALKGPKLCPVISPKKTISGAIGGVVGGLIGSMAVFGLFMLNDPFRSMYVALNLNVWYFLFFGFVGAIMCQFVYRSNTILLR